MPVLSEKKVYSYEDIDKLPEGFYEIIDGEVINLAPTGFEHGSLELSIGMFLNKHLKDKGYIAVGEVGILIHKNPLRIRGADIVYISKDKAPEKPTGILELPPNLIIEILSPNNTISEIEEKIEDYFKIGTERLIIINPAHKKIYIYQNGKNIVEIYNFDDEIEFINGLKGKLMEIINQY